MSTQEKQSLIVEPHELSNIKKTIGIVSGKGGVGKSIVTSMLAVSMERRNHKVGIIDADITGPSIPKSFGLTEKAHQSEFGIYPVKSKSGISIMSVNLMLEDETDPVIWRGPLLGDMVKKYWQEVIWGNIDYMFIDMPPGTGDVALTTFQSIKLDGIIIVTTPQELVSSVVTKAVKMAKLMNVPIIGIVENMSYYKCSNCETEFPVFGESKLESYAKEQELEVLARIPIAEGLSKVCDNGIIELFKGDWLETLAEKLEQ